MMDALHIPPRRPAPPPLPELRERVQAAVAGSVLDTPANVLAIAKVLDSALKCDRKKPAAANSVYLPFSRALENAGYNLEDLFCALRGDA